MLKRSTLIILSVILILSVTVLPSSARTPDICVGASVVDMQTSKGSLRGYTVDGLCYVPLYIFADTLGGSIYGWSFSERAAYIKADGLYLTATPGNYYICANDRYLFTEKPILDFDGTVYVPIKPLTKAMGLTIKVNSANSVTLSGTGHEYIMPGSKYYHSDAVYWLSRIISAEAGGEPFLGKMAVGNVVMNRVASRQYPNTIWGVIFDRKYGVQFTPAANGRVYRTPDEKSVIAAKICLEGYNLNENMLFFFNPRIATSSWIARSCTFIMRIGNHDFYG